MRRPDIAVYKPGSSRRSVESSPSGSSVSTSKAVSPRPENDNSNTCRSGDAANIGKTKKKPRAEQPKYVPKGRQAKVLSTEEVTAEKKQNSKGIVGDSAEPHRSQEDIKPSPLTTGIKVAAVNAFVFYGSGSGTLFRGFVPGFYGSGSGPGSSSSRGIIFTRALGQGLNTVVYCLPLSFYVSRG